MEISKLLNVISDLDNEERDSSINSLLSNLATNISSGDTAQIANSEIAVRMEFENSRVNHYTPSNYEIVSFIGGDKFFGLNAYQQVQEILFKSHYNIQKTLKDLQEYIKQRTKFIEDLDNSRSALLALNFKAFYPRDDNYQVGILLPEDFTGNKISMVTKELLKWDKVFKTFKELTGEDSEDTKISFVSNGSLEFFIDSFPQIGLCLSFTISKIIDTYKKFIEIRKLRQQLKELGITQAEQKNIEKQEKEQFTNELEKAAMDIIKEFAVKKMEEGRLNEIKVAVKGHVKYIATCIDNGITIEINPPEIHSPEPSTTDNKGKATDEEKKIQTNYEKKLKQIEVVQKSMDLLKSIGKTGLGIGKFLTSGEEPVTEE